MLLTYPTYRVHKIEWQTLRRDRSTKGVSPCVRIVVILAFALPDSSRAAAFQIPGQNISGLGTAYTGVGATSENASTAYSNPAGMTNLSGTRVSGGLLFIDHAEVYHSNSLDTAPLGLPSAEAANGVNAGGLAVLPNGYISSQIASNLWLGLALTAPYGLEVDYNDQWLGRFQAQQAGIKSILIT
jgi:long-chain fatty acid transport protein